MKRIDILGVPSSAGARQTGQERAPQSYRQAGLVEKLSAAGLAVVDLGDQPEAPFQPDRQNPTAQNLQAVIEVVNGVANQVRIAAREDTMLLILGGDCTITLGVVAGLINYAPSLGLMYFDGDLDLNTPESTPSGILDGMVMAHMTGKGASALSRSGPHYPLMAEENIVMFGYNEPSGFIDAFEIDALQRSRMTRYPVSQIRGNVIQSARAALTHLENRVNSIVLHFDVDVIDSGDFSAADVPHADGMSFDDAMSALGIFVASRQVDALVITEFNPVRDPDGSLAKRLIDAVTTQLKGRWD